MAAVRGNQGLILRNDERAATEDRHYSTFDVQQSVEDYGDSWQILAVV